MKNIFMILFIFGCLLFTNQSYCDSPTSELDEQQKAIKQLQEEISTLSRNFQQFQSQQQLKDHLQREVSEFKNTFLDKTLKNVDLALQGSNKAISLITVFALSFTIITFLLGLFGFREIAAINKVRKDAEKNLRLTKHLSLGSAYTQSFLYSEAVKEFIKVLEFDPDNYAAHYHLGFLFGALIRPDQSKSKSHCKEAIRLNPREHINYLNLGVAMNASGDRQEDVLSIYLAGEKQAIDNGADDITIGKFKLFAGHCYKSLGKKSEAKARYDEARPLFEKYKDHKIVQIANEATRWLSELENCYLAVKT